MKPISIAILTLSLAALACASFQAGPGGRPSRTATPTAHFTPFPGSGPLVPEPGQPAATATPMSSATPEPTGEAPAIDWACWLETTLDRPMWVLPGGPVVLGPVSGYEACLRP